MIDSFQNIAVTSFPDITKIDFKSIENKYLKVILINVSFIFLILFTLLAIADYKDIFELHYSLIWFYVALAVVFGFVFILNIIGFRKENTQLEKKMFHTKKVLFFRSLTTVPFNRVQHVEIDQSPISRFFNLVSLSVFTAGDSSDDLKIRGIFKEEAQQIKEFISNKIDG